MYIGYKLNKLANWCKLIITLVKPSCNSIKRNPIVVVGPQEENPKKSPNVPKILRKVHG